MHNRDDMLKRYDRFGWDFAAINPITAKEIEWYLHYARITGGPVLELACGTGRLLCELATEGFSVTGIDLSQTMLDIAEKNVGKLQSTIQEHTRLVREDMSNFSLEERFGLIYIAGNSFRELTDPEQRLRCLRCVARHLRSDSVFLTTERRFDPSWFEGGNHRSSDWSEPNADPQTGWPVQRRFELELSRDRKSISGQFLYRTRRPDGTEHIEACPILAPVMTVADYEALFAAADLNVKTYVGYDHRPDDGTDPSLCFVCQVR